MKNSTLQRMDVVFLAVTLTGLSGLMAAVFLLSQSMVLRLSVCGVSVVVAACVVMMRISARKQFIAFSEGVCRRLDGMVEGSEGIQECLEDETLPAKIGAKLLKIGEITQGAAEQSEQGKKNIQTLVSDISHQLKTPLSNIKMAAETLADEHTDAERRRFFLTGLKGQVDKLGFLIEAMTKISRLENNMIVPKPEPSPLSELLETAIMAVRSMAGEKRIEISCGETDTLLYFDMRWTTEAVFNILENAVKYTPDCGEVAVSVHPMALYTRIDIRDTGIGILPEHINDIFKRFYRENRLRQADGVGVGLYLAREIISKQGGYITAKSTPGKGTTLSVCLQNSDGKKTAKSQIS